MVLGVASMFILTYSAICIAVENFWDGGSVVRRRWAFPKVWRRAEKDPEGHPSLKVIPTSWKKEYWKCGCSNSHPLTPNSAK
jgi:hypothetical protein